MRKIHTIAFVVIALALVLGPAASRLAAQATPSGTIEGRITDRSQASVGGAEVGIKNKGTDLTRTITTSDAGTYRFELLPVGTYTVTVNKVGFATTS